MRNYKLVSAFILSAFLFQIISAGLTPCFAEEEKPKEEIIEKGYGPAALSCWIPGLGQWYARGFKGNIPRKTIGHFVTILALDSINAIVLPAISVVFPPAVFLGCITILPIPLIHIWSAYDAYIGREESFMDGYL